MKESTVASVALHMDSLAWAAGESASPSQDPTWFRVMDRFLDLAAKKGFPLTVFAIAKDLEDEEIARRAREIDKAGHEIANHSYEHRMDLGALGVEEVSEDVERAHEVIAGALGKGPRGFAAPAWNRSPVVLDAASRAGHLYDASAFPSWLMAPMLAKLFWNFRFHPRRREIMARRDALSWLVGPRQPVKGSFGLVEIPVPTTRRLRLPCWHTLSFVCPRPLFDGILDECLELSWFMYILHPADLMGPEDVPQSFRKAAKSVERLFVPLSEKEKRLEEVIDRILAQSKAMVTCEKMALSSIGKRGASSTMEDGPSADEEKENGEG